MKQKIIKLDFWSWAAKTKCLSGSISFPAVWMYDGWRSGRSRKLIPEGFRLSLYMARDKFSSNCETFVELEGLSQSCTILERGQKAN